MCRTPPAVHSTDMETIVSVAIFAAVLLSMGASLGAQSAPDSAQCRAALDAASRDSQSVRIDLLVFPLDRANHISADYGGLIGAGIRQFLASRIRWRSMCILRARRS